MNWISELFKHVTGSKIFTFSLFLTSSFLLLGNRYVSSEIPKPQANIKLVIIGLCIFSGTILAISILNFLWSFLFSTANGLKIRGKGFAEENTWDETIVWRSAKGSKKALHLMKLRIKTNV